VSVTGMNAVNLLPLDVLISVVLTWIALGMCALLLQRSVRLITTLIFPLARTGCAGTGRAAVSVLLDSSPQSIVLRWVFPTCRMHLRLDPLSAFFLILLGRGDLRCVVVRSGYFRHLTAGPWRCCASTYQSVSGRHDAGVLADDAYMFHGRVEVHALSSYFLVTTDHNLPDIRKPDSFTC